MFKKFVMIISFSILVFGCSDSVLDGVADKDSSEAESVKLENALNEQNYTYIIDVLDNRNNRTPREDYLLQNAKLGSTGFSLLKLFDLFDADNITAGDIFTKALGIDDDITAAELAAKREIYKTVKSFCLDSSNAVISGISNDLAMACGIAASGDIILSLAEVAADGGSVSFDPNSPDYFVKKLETNPGLINNVDLSSANTSLSLVGALVDTVASTSGNTGFETTMNDYLGQLTDASGDITHPSLDNFIRNYL